jgi:hypothetical protein
MVYRITEPVRALEFLVGDVPGGESGVCFDSGNAAANVPMPAGQLVSVSTADIVGPWDPTNADVGISALRGILGYPLLGTYTEATEPVSYLARGPVRVRSKYGRLTYLGYGSTQGDAAAVAALAALGIHVVN